MGRPRHTGGHGLFFFTLHRKHLVIQQADSESLGHHQLHPREHDGEEEDDHPAPGAVHKLHRRRPRRHSASPRRGKSSPKPQTTTTTLYIFSLASSPGPPANEATGEGEESSRAGSGGAQGERERGREKERKEMSPDARYFSPSLRWWRPN